MIDTDSLELGLQMTNGMVANFKMDRSKKLDKGQIIRQRTNNLSFDKCIHLSCLSNDKLVSMGTQFLDFLEADRG